MFRNMVTSLFKYDRIRTTDAKAKQLRVWADRLVTLAKQGDLHARRQALSIVREKDIVHKLFDEAKDRFGSISGGYTRIVKLGRRHGDGAPISIVELAALEKTKKKKAKKKKAVASAVEATEKVESTAEVTDTPGPEVETADGESADSVALDKPSEEPETLKSDGPAEEESEKKAEKEPEP
jgi:large subunit ribosomal protein L17